MPQRGAAGARRDVLAGALERWALLWSAGLMCAMLSAMDQEDR